MEMAQEPSNLIENRCYLPHHGVLRESRATTKLRVVFNGSQRTTSHQFGQSNHDVQDVVREYFSMDRHANVECFYLCQTYARIPEHLICDNANRLILFKKDGTNLKRVYNDQVNTDMSYDEFCTLCRDCWHQKYGFLVIDKVSALTNMKVDTERDLTKGISRYRKVVSCCRYFARDEHGRFAQA
ncbi:hypothetical protein ALC57_01253 [Trachymyrmex cornetzi]|uniref:Uncharacterized protein n=1 Tax=Trachymyrmex cornetzi TaxID=471704 RepID=A0A151JQ03_9HYME|nr:hypothetical protein ALC57_01253 [Trachymyrmex cornetzi]